MTVDEKNDASETGLDIAVKREHQDIVDAIRHYKADNSD